MIDLTPLEVRQKKGDFSKGLRGYDPGEVDDFLALVADRLEALVKENMGLKDRFGRLEEQLDEFKRRERALTDALVTAQQMREEVRKQSSREAEILMKEAQQEAERVRAGAAQAREKEEEILRRLRARQSQLIQSYRTFLERELTELAVVAESLGAASEEQARRKPTKSKARGPKAEESQAPSSLDEEIAVGSFAAELATLAGSARAPAEPASPKKGPEARTPRDVIEAPEDVVPAEIPARPEAGAPEDLLPTEPVLEEPEELEPEATPAAAEAEGEPWDAPATSAPGPEEDDLPLLQLEEGEEEEDGERPTADGTPEDEYALAMEIEEELDDLREAEDTGDEPMPWEAQEEEADQGPDPWAEALDFGLEEEEQPEEGGVGEQLELAGDDADDGGADEQVEEEEGDEPDWLSSILKEKP